MKNYCLVLLIMATLLNSCLIAQKDVVSPEIWVREGYKLSIVQKDITNPRDLVMNTEGVLFVSLHN